MNKSIWHQLYVSTMVVIIILATAYLFYAGNSYYNTSIEERFYHPRHDWFKPSGAFGHGLGIIGTFMILFGVVIYIARKRYNFMSRLIRLKYLLEFHIFLCTLGPILVLFHTAFKFGGIVSVAFWSMVAVVLSGVIGRFIYIQIPRTIEGRALGLNEVHEMRLALNIKIKQNTNIDASLVSLLEQDLSIGSARKTGSFINKTIDNQRLIRQVKKELRLKRIDTSERQQIISAIKNERSLASKISRLNRMQQLFKYWHVAHLPFALIMLIIIVIHVIVTLVFGYKWIF